MLHFLFFSYLNFRSFTRISKGQGSSSQLGAAEGRLLFRLVRRGSVLTDGVRIIRIVSKGSKEQNRIHEAATAASDATAAARHLGLEDGSLRDSGAKQQVAA